MSETGRAPLWWVWMLLVPYGSTMDVACLIALRWIPRDSVMLLFGLSMGLRGSTWLGFFHPLTAFFVSYLVGGLALWKVGNLLQAGRF